MSTTITPKQRAKGCHHFNGIQHATCNASVSYGLLRQQHNGEALLPCLPDWSEKKGKPIATCAAFRYSTVEEIEQEEKESAEAVTKYLTALDNNLCPSCGQSTEPKRQVGRCVYGACGHRLYQGRLTR